MLHLRLALLISLAISPACGDDDASMPAADAGPGTDAAAGDGGPEPLPQHCENVNPITCLAPWPSSRWLVEDTSTATGRRVQIPIEAMPRNTGDVPVDPAQFNRFDGFTPSTSIVTVYPELIDPVASRLPDEDHIADSLAADSPTVLIDVATGERVAHFSEVDRYRRGRRAGQEAFYIRPAARLKQNTRYVVATRGLVDDDGAPIAASHTFAALRDGTPSGDAQIEARRDGFEEIFDALASAGVERASLIEAWDFWTGTDASWYRDLLHMRDDVLPRLGADGLGCTVTRVEEPVGDANVFRRIEGTFTVPRYIRPADPDQPRVNEWDPPSRLIRDPATGLPMAMGTAEAPFLALIPNSVAERVRAGEPGAARLLTYGHGLFGGTDEAGGSYVRGMAQQTGMVIVATDWWGMAEADRPHAVEMVAELSRFPELTERLHQGVINFVALTRAFMGSCRELPEMQVDGMPTYDAGARYYLGISQGSIAGGVLAGISTDIERFALNVGAINYALMTKRSIDAAPFYIVLDTYYPSRIEADLLWAMAQMQWDTAEPATFAGHLLADPLPGTPPKRLLYAIGRYDAQVPNAASDVAARTIGLPLLTPSPYTPWGVETTAGPVDSAYVIYDLNDEPTPRGTAQPSGDNEAHEGVRRSASYIEQMDRFFTPDGRVEHTCDGPCDPD